MSGRPAVRYDYQSYQYYRYEKAETAALTRGVGWTIPKYYNQRRKMNTIHGKRIVEINETKRTNSRRNAHAKHTEHASAKTTRSATGPARILNTRRLPTGNDRGRIGFAAAAAAPRPGRVVSSSRSGWAPTTCCQPNGPVRALRYSTAAALACTRAHIRLPTRRNEKTSFSSPSSAFGWRHCGPARRRTHSGGNPVFLTDSIAAEAGRCGGTRRDDDGR